MRKKWIKLMPQFDLFEVFHQFFWLLWSFIYIFIMIDAAILPRVYKLLRSRKFFVSDFFDFKRIHFEEEVNKRLFFQIVSFRRRSVPFFNDRGAIQLFTDIKNFYKDNFFSALSQNFLFNINELHFFNIQEANEKK